MASSLFHKLLKNQIKSTSIILKPKNPFLIPPLSSNPFLLEQTLAPNQPNPNLYQYPTLDSFSPNSVPIFPSFPFGYCLNGVLSTGSLPEFGSVVGEVVFSEMWADSVKKKRKKKMNKHKLKKLRKRLRRKT